MRRLSTFVGAVLLAGAALLLLPGPVAAAPAVSAVPAMTDHWDDRGPYAVAVAVGPVTTLYYPEGIENSPSRHPVILWGNGTFALPLVYGPLLRHWASHGFIVAAANTPQSGTAAEMLTGLNHLAALDRRPDSVFGGRVDLTKVGASGHSQGGGAAINAARDPRVTTVVAIQPGPLAEVDWLHGPTLFLAGEKDLIVPPSGWVKGFYEGADHVPAVYAELRGARHLTGIGSAGGFRGAATAWFRFHLVGDERGRGVYFGADCGICTDQAWRLVRRNSLARAVAGPAGS